MLGHVRRQTMSIFKRIITSLYLTGTNNFVCEAILKDDPTEKLCVCVCMCVCMYTRKYLICVHTLNTYLASLVAQMVENQSAMQETWVWSLCQKNPLEKEMATHSSILAWRIPWTEEPGRLHGVAKSWTWLSNFHFHTHTHTFNSKRTASDTDLKD